MLRVLLVAAMLMAGAGSAAAEPVRVGIVVTLGGASGALGRHARDGFLLGVKQNGGKLGDSEALVSVVDDGRNAQTIGETVSSLIKTQRVDFILGPLFPDLIGPALKAASDGKAVMISPHAGPADLAGKRCQANFFSLAPQDDEAIEVLAKYAEDRKLNRAIIVSTQGEEADTAATGFTRAFKGTVADRILIKPDATDFSEQINRIDVLRPQAVFLHMRGDVGTRFLAQLSQSGAAAGLVLLGSTGFDEAELPDHLGASVGTYTAGGWAYGLQTPQNQAFITAFEAEYGYAPGAVAMHAYDAAQLIDSAVRLLKGDVADKAAMADALKQADIESPRGKFSFGNNNFPIQDMYLARVDKRGDGQVRTQIVSQVFAQYGDHYAADCPLK